MPRANILRKSLRDQKWQIAGFGLTLALVGALDVLIWPSYRDSLQNLDLPNAIQAFLGTDLSIATAPGFISTEFFSWTPILMIVYAVIQGTGAVAGEEGGGTMDLLLAQPLTRRTIIVEKAAATFIGSALILLIAFCGFLVTVPAVEIAISLSAVAQAIGNMLPITLLFYALALWLGSVAPSRGLAAGVAIGVVTAGYFVNTVAQGVEALHGLRYATPFYYYGAGLPLVRGIEWAHVALLIGIAAVFFVLTLRAFERRDITTGGGSDVDLFGSMRRVFAR